MSVFQGYMYVCKEGFHCTYKISRLQKFPSYKKFLSYGCRYACMYLLQYVGMYVFVTTLGIVDDPPPPYDVFNSWRQTSDHTPLQPITPHSYYDNFCKLVKKKQLNAGESF